MELDQRLLKPFLKAKYLSEKNYQRYTTIIHFLYKQHEVFYAPPSLPEEILAFIKKTDTFQLFQEYGEKELEQDLQALEEWGNVLSHHDSSHVSRIEDFKRKRLRYQCTQETIEIERMLEKLNSQVHRLQGSLDAKLVESLTQCIASIRNLQPGDLTKEKRSEIEEIWTELFERFDKLRKEASDYLGIIHSKNVEEIMQNKEITPFRLKFTQYLTEFIISLQENTLLIELYLKEINRSENLKWVVDVLIAKQQEKVSLEEEMTDAEIKDIYQNQWAALEKWFLFDEFGERFVNFLTKQTNETISKFTRYLQRLSEKEQQAKSRKHEFLHMASLFYQEENLTESAKYFAAVTNVQNAPKLFISQDDTLLPDQRIVDQAIQVFSLKDPKKIGIRQKKEFAATTMSEEDRAKINQYNEELKRKERVIEAFTSQGAVRLKELSDIDPFLRTVILNWISRSKEKGKEKTENGIYYTIATCSEEWIVLRCTDGNLTMPDYQLNFEVSS